MEKIVKIIQVKEKETIVINAHEAAQKPRAKK